MLAGALKWGVRAIHSRAGAALIARVRSAHARPLTHLPPPRRRRADGDLVTPRLANQPTNSRPADVVTR